MKIIAGKYKGRNIPSAKGADYRPTTGQFREALFNILVSTLNLNEKKVLDLYCGTGSLGFEALSRGAKLATFIDIHPTHLKYAKEFAAAIGEKENASFLQMDASNLAWSSYKYDLVFIDPPYNKKLLDKTLSSLQKGNWLEPEATIILELARTEDVVIPDNMVVSTERRYGNSKLIILEIVEV